MGAHKKYRDMMDALSKVDVHVSIARESYNSYILCIGNKEHKFNIRSTCNKHLERIFINETNKPLLFY